LPGMPRPFVGQPCRSPSFVLPDGRLQSRGHEASTIAQSTGCAHHHRKIPCRGLRPEPSGQRGAAVHAMSWHTGMRGSATIRYSSKSCVHCSCANPPRQHLPFFFSDHCSNFLKHSGTRSETLQPCPSLGADTDGAQRFAATPVNASFVNYRTFCPN